MILSILYRTEYAAWAHLLRWASVSGAFYFAATLLAYGLTAADELRVQPILGLTSACATVVGCELLVGRWGLVGAVWGFGIGAAVQVLGQAMVLVKSFPPRGAATPRITAP
jgi:O-antigen/teichoic acid export membrane protein